MARVYILQGFLGAGKTTFARKLAAETGAEVLCPDAYCLSCFSPEEYEKDWEKCFSRAVSLLWKQAEAAVQSGKDVILDIERQGAVQVCAKRPETVRIFIAPPSWKELERRLKDRGTDDPEKVQKRLLRAKVEFQTAHTYDYFVINDTVEDAVRELDAIITAEHCKPKERMSVLAE